MMTALPEVETTSFMSYVARSGVGKNSQLTEEQIDNIATRIASFFDADQLTVTILKGFVNQHGIPDLLSSQQLSMKVGQEFERTNTALLQTLSASLSQKTYNLGTGYSQGAQYESRSREQLVEIIITLVGQGREQVKIAQDLGTRFIRFQDWIRILNVPLMEHMKNICNGVLEDDRTISLFKTEISDLRERLEDGPDENLMSSLKNDMRAAKKRWEDLEINLLRETEAKDACARELTVAKERISLLERDRDQEANRSQNHRALNEEYIQRLDESTAVQRRLETELSQTQSRLREAERAAIAVRGASEAAEAMHQIRLELEERTSRSTALEARLKTESERLAAALTRETRLTSDGQAAKARCSELDLMINESGRKVTDLANELRMERSKAKQTDAALEDAKKREEKARAAEQEALQRGTENLRAKRDLDERVKDLETQTRQVEDSLEGERRVMKKRNEDIGGLRSQIESLSKDNNRLETDLLQAKNTEAFRSRAREEPEAPSRRPERVLAYGESPIPFSPSTGTNTRASSSEERLLLVAPRDTDMTPIAMYAILDLYAYHCYQLEERKDRSRSTSRVEALVEQAEPSGLNYQFKTGRALDTREMTFERRKENFSNERGMVNSASSPFFSTNGVRELGDQSYLRALPRGYCVIPNRNRTSHHADNMVQPVFGNDAWYDLESNLIYEDFFARLVTEVKIFVTEFSRTLEPSRDRFEAWIRDRIGQIQKLRADSNTPTPLSLEWDIRLSEANRFAPPAERALLLLMCQCEMLTAQTLAVTAAERIGPQGIWENSEAREKRVLYILRRFSVSRSLANHWQAPPVDKRQEIMMALGCTPLNTVMCVSLHTSHWPCAERLITPEAEGRVLEMGSALVLRLGGTESAGLRTNFASLPSSPVGSQGKRPVQQTPQRENPPSYRNATPQQSPQKGFSGQGETILDSPQADFLRQKLGITNEMIPTYISLAEGDLILFAMSTGGISHPKVDANVVGHTGNTPHEKVVVSVAGQRGNFVLGNLAHALASLEIVVKGNKHADEDRKFREKDLMKMPEAIFLAPPDKNKEFFLVRLCAYPAVNAPATELYVRRGPDTRPRTTVYQILGIKNADGSAGEWEGSDILNLATGHLSGRDASGHPWLTMKHIQKLPTQFSVMTRVPAQRQLPVREVATNGSEWFIKAEGGARSQHASVLIPCIFCAKLVQLSGIKKHCSDMMKKAVSSRVRHEPTVTVERTRFEALVREKNLILMILADKEVVDWVAVDEVNRPRDELSPDAILPPAPVDEMNNPPTLLPESQSAEVQFREGLSQFVIQDTTDYRLNRGMEAATLNSLVASLLKTVNESAVPVQDFEYIPPDVLRNLAGLSAEETRWSARKLIPRLGEVKFYVMWMGHTPEVGHYVSVIITRKTEATVNFMIMESLDVKHSLLETRIKEIVTTVRLNAPVLKNRPSLKVTYSWEHAGAKMCTAVDSSGRPVGNSCGPCAINNYFRLLIGAPLQSHLLISPSAMAITNGRLDIFEEEVKRVIALFLANPESFDRRASLTRRSPRVATPNVPVRDSAIQQPDLFPPHVQPMIPRTVAPFAVGDAEAHQNIEGSLGRPPIAAVNAEIVRRANRDPPLNYLDTGLASNRVLTQRPMQFGILRGIDARMPEMSLVRRGIALTTRRTHLRLIRELQRLPAAYDTMPIAEAICGWMHLKREGVTPQARMGRTWKWSTMRKELGSIAGALKNLSSYDPSRDPIHLARLPSWRAALRAADSLKNVQSKKQARAASLDSVLKAIDITDNLQIKQLLALMWITAARPSDALQLRREDLTQDARIADQLTVTIKRGKVIKTRGFYSIHTAITGKFKEVLLPMLADRSSRWIWLAPSASDRQRILAAVNQTLRAADPLLTSYGLRRGSVQHIADTGADIKTLLGITGHTNERQLMQYLDFGEKFMMGKEAGMKRGLTLASPHPPQPPRTS